MLIVYSKKLDSIKDEVLAIGSKIIEANELILEAMKSKNYNLFDDAKSSLKNLERVSDKIDNMIINILALYTPEARDLRVLVAYLKITNELIRASDNTKDFIKGFSKVRTYESIDLKDTNSHIIELHKSAIVALKRALEIADIEYEYNIENEFKTKDIFNNVLVEEAKSDDLCSIAQSHIFNYIVNQKEFTKEYCELLSSIRRLEKIADRAVSIGNLLLYAHLGGELQKA